MKLFTLVVLVSASLYSNPAFSHGSSGKPPTQNERSIVFPDTKEYLTLVTDLHTHSVFSDGHVWPKIRVGEALKDGLDGLAITEHLEYQPHRADILHPDRNRAIQQASESAVDSDLIIIPGSEITRDMPAGHINAIFIQDANKLINVKNVPKDDGDVAGFYAAAKEWPAQSAVEAAAQQGAFLFWNHPYWARQTPDGIARITDFHASNAKNNMLHGIEIANGNTYSEEAFAIALEHNLALIGVSDVHDLIDWDYKPEHGGHRPVTLVFASEKSLEGLKEALFDQRTVVWFKNLLIGRPQHLTPLLHASISVSDLQYQDGTSVAKITITNHSDAHFKLSNESEFTFMETGDLIELAPHSETTVSVKVSEKANKITLPFQVINTLVGPKEHATISLKASVNFFDSTIEKIKKMVTDS